MPGRRWVTAALVFALAACATTPRPPDDSRPPLTAVQIAALLSGADRTAADRQNDLRRKPAQMLEFIGVRPGMVALDLSAGGGYTTELLARAIGPTGTVYGQSAPRNLATPAPAVAEGPSAPAAASAASSAPAPRGSLAALAERQARMQAAAVAAAPIIGVAQPFDSPVPAERASQGLDLVTLMFNYHDLGYLQVDRDRMNRAVYRALKPGGAYVIADHAGRAGTGIAESGTLHRIDEAFLRQEVEAAGLRWVAQADFLRNPLDPRDRNTPPPGQSKDEFVFKFVKP